MNPKASAFPQSYISNDNDRGISTRDYIAIEAMKGMLANPVLSNNPHGVVESAERAYVLADALIAESNKK